MADEDYLSDEEKAALETDPDESGALKNVLEEGGESVPDKKADPPDPDKKADETTGKEKLPDPDKKGDDTDKKPDDTAGKVTPDADKDKGGETPSEPAADDDTDVSHAPQFQVDPKRIEEIDQRLEALKTEKAELATNRQQQRAELSAKLEAGDIEVTDYIKQAEQIDADYNSKVEALGEERLTLATEKTTLDSKVEFNQMSGEELWVRDQKVFFAKAENKDLYNNPIKRGAMNEAVKSLGSAKENVNRSNTWILEQAKKQVEEAFGLTPQKPENKDDKTNDPPPPDKKPTPTQGPQTLADVPAAEGADDVTEGNDEFAELDRMIDQGDVMGYETALARMPAEKQQQYLDVGHPDAPEYRRKQGASGS